MSLNPTQIPNVAYSGTPVNQLVSIGNPPTQSPRIVPLTFNWLTYYLASGNLASVSVPINLQLGTVQGGLMDRILSCKIDNTNSLIGVSVFFPDTGDVVTCGPQTVVTAPVMSNGLQCFVIAQGLSAAIGLTQTKVYLANFYAPAFNDPQQQLTFPQWIGSTALQRANLLTPGYGPPALGDQLDNAECDLNTQVAVPVFGSPLAAGTIIVTSLSLIMSGETNANINHTTVVFKDVTANDILVQGTFLSAAAQNVWPSVLAIISSGNIKLNAAHSFVLQATDQKFNRGNAVLNVAYCYIPA